MLGNARICNPLYNPLVFDFLLFWQVFRLNNFAKNGIIITFVSNLASAKFAARWFKSHLPHQQIQTRFLLKDKRQVCCYFVTLCWDNCSIVIAFYHM